MPGRILVAEDDPQMLLLIVEALRGEGHQVEHVSDGEQLLEELTRRPERLPFDLIVSDIRLPTLSGLQVVEALREAQRTIPIVLMTAFGDDETRAEAERLGVVLVDKPFALDDLSAPVARLATPPSAARA